MKRRVLVLTSIIALVAGATILVAARSEAIRGHLRMVGFQHPGGPGHGFGQEMLDHIARELNLTDSQKSQIKTQFDAVQPTFSSLHEKMDNVDKQLESATANGQFVETQVRTLATQKAELMADMFVEHERMKSKIYAILTTEQRAKADEMLKRHHGHPGFH